MPVNRQEVGQKLQETRTLERQIRRKESELDELGRQERSIVRRRQQIQSEIAALRSSWDETMIQVRRDTADLERGRP